MCDYLYAVKDIAELCKKRDYRLLTPDGKVLYSDETADDLKAQGYEILDSPGFKALWSEQWELYKSVICGNWKEITAERYNDMLDSLPPLKWTNGGFFLSEMYNEDISSFFQKWYGKYYESMQSINSPRSDILSELKTCIENGSVLQIDETCE